MCAGRLDLVEVNRASCACQLRRNTRKRLPRLPKAPPNLGPEVQKLVEVGMVASLLLVGGCANSSRIASAHLMTL